MRTIAYANVVGIIMSWIVCKRSDLAHAISVISKFMADLGYAHWEVDI